MATYIFRLSYSAVVFKLILAQLVEALFSICKSNAFGCWKHSNWHARTMQLKGGNIALANGCLKSYIEVFS